MQWYHITLIIMAGIAALAAWRVPNAVAWVGVGLLMAFMTSFAHLNGLEFALAFGAVTNLVMCRMIYIFAKSAWEMRLFQAFILMIAIDFLFAVGVIKTQYLFAVSLEIVNAYALLLVTTTGIMERVARHGGFDSGHYRRLLGSLHRALFRAPKAYPQWWRHP